MIAASVAAHTGVVVSDARVHANPEVPGATRAMNARAFAYGTDIFLGRGESETDVALMAHELAHVAQQRGGGAVAPQRKIAIGEAGNPAEAEADRVASDVVSGNAPAALLIDSGAATKDQMVLATFLAQLQPLVTAAATEELGQLGSAAACPYIAMYFARYCHPRSSRTSSTNRTTSRPRRRSTTSARR